MKKNSLEVWSPDEFKTETPIFVRSTSNEKIFLLFQGKKTEIPTQSIKGGWQGEFQTNLPGQYKILHSQGEFPFVVQQYERFAFGKELFFTATSVALFFVLFLLHVRKNKWKGKSA